MIYTVEAAKEASIGQGVNGTGRRVWIKGAYVVCQGRRVRAFTEREGGFEAAQKWAEYLNENMN